MGAGGRGKPRGMFVCARHREPVFHDAVNGKRSRLFGKLRTVGLFHGEGVTRLGVDYESINPSGSAFWQKHFTEYGYGVVRRIDDGAVNPAL